MTDATFKIETDDHTEAREVMSPEGVEERVVHDGGFRITLTCGGKYRVYRLENGRAVPLGLDDSLEGAKKSIAKMAILEGMLVVDPEQCSRMILRAMKGGAPDAA